MRCCRIANRPGLPASPSPSGTSDPVNHGQVAACLHRRSSGHPRRLRCAAEASRGSATAHQRLPLGSRRTGATSPRRYLCRSVIVIAITRAPHSARGTFRGGSGTTAFVLPPSSAVRSRWRHSVSSQGRPRRRPCDRSQTLGAVLPEGAALPRLSRQQQPAAAPTASNRGCLHENAGAPDRSAVSLLHLVEQAPAEVVGALSPARSSGPAVEHAAIRRYGLSRPP